MRDDTQRLATTRLGDFEALAAGGQPVMLAWAQLHRFLDQALSPAHAALLAEPIADAEAGTVDWYGPRGSVRPLDAAGKAGLAALVGDVARLTEELNRAGDESRRLLGNLLRLALEIPGEAQVHLVGDQPVLVAWGHVARDAGERRGLLLRYVAVPPTPPEPPPPRIQPVPSTRGRTMLALAVVLLLGLSAAAWLAWVLGLPTPCCRVDPAGPRVLAELDAERTRESALRAALSDTRRQIAAQRAQCRPATPPAPPAPPPPPRPPATSLPPSVKPSMPSAPKKPVDVVPLPPPDAPPPPPADAPRSEAPPPPPDDDDQRRVAQAGGKQGRLQVTLGWDDVNDVDLAVQCPSGEIVSFRQRRGCAGGVLDVDANWDVHSMRRDAVENIVWFDDPPPGRYRILVTLFKQRGRVESPFRLTVRRQGKPDQRIQGVVHARDGTVTVAEITVP